MRVNGWIIALYKFVLLSVAATEISLYGCMVTVSLLHEIREEELQQNN